MCTTCSAQKCSENTLIVIRFGSMISIRVLTCNFESSQWNKKNIEKMKTWKQVETRTNICISESNTIIKVSFE